MQTHSQIHHTYTKIHIHIYTHKSTHKYTITHIHIPHIPHTTHIHTLHVHITSPTCTPYTHTHTHTPLQGSPLTGKAGWINLGDTRHPSGQIPSLQRAGSLGVHLSWLTKTPVWPTEWPEVANGNTGQPVRHEFLINRN